MVQIKFLEVQATSQSISTRNQEEIKLISELIGIESVKSELINNRK